MKFCRTCGAPMDDNVTFCPMCGSKSSKVNKEIVSVNINLKKFKLIIIVLLIIVVIFILIFSSYKIATKDKWGELGDNLYYDINHIGLSITHLHISADSDVLEDSWDTFQKYPWEKIAGRITDISVNEYVDYIPLSTFANCNNKNLEVSIYNPNCEIEYIFNDTIVPTLGYCNDSPITVLVMRNQLQKIM